MHERASIPHAADSPWAFVSFAGPGRTRSGRPLTTRRVQQIVERLAREASVRHIHPHMLRHTFGATATDLDLARDVTQSLLGHDSLQSQEVYRHVAGGRLVDAARLVGERLEREGAR